MWRKYENRLKKGSFKVMTGTPEGPIIDSALTDNEAIAQNPQSICPDEIFRKLKLFFVLYWSFDGLVHKGQLVMDGRLEADVKEIFEIMFAKKFPISCVIPMSHPKINWDENISMNLNNTTAFTYRTVTFDPSRISYHGYGWAIDINQLLNPYIKGDIILPPEARYDPSKPGTISLDSFLVKEFKKRGWFWGGDFEGRIDYQHFERHSV